MSEDGDFSWNDYKKKRTLFDEIKIIKALQCLFPAFKNIVSVEEKDFYLKIGVTSAFLERVFKPIIPDSYSEPQISRFLFKIY